MGVNAFSDLLPYSATQRLPSLPATTPVGSDDAGPMGYSTIPEISAMSQRDSSRRTSGRSLGRRARGRSILRRPKRREEGFQLMMNLAIISIPGQIVPPARSRRLGAMYHGEPDDCHGEQNQARRFEETDCTAR